MSRILPTRLRLAVVAALAAATTLAAGATDASATDAAPAQAAAARFETFTSLNLGKNLASNLTGNAVATTPQSTSTLQQWERKTFLNIPNPPGGGFGAPYQLRNRATQRCLQDVGNGSTVIETTCQVSPSSTSPQLWHNHGAVDRTVNGKAYRFRFNRASGRVLSVAPQFGTTVPVLSSPRASNIGSAAAALQLWTTTRIA